jgi:hypothetical protein
MKIIYAAAVIAAGMALTPVAAAAQDRLVDGALGAGAGALVGGPVGAVVGGVVGYSAGPQISRGMGLEGRRHYRHRRHHTSHRTVHREYSER